MKIKLNDLMNYRKAYAHARKGWSYTLRLWRYYTAIDLVLVLLFFIAGILIGIGI